MRTGDANFEQKFSFSPILASPKIIKTSIFSYFNLPPPEKVFGGTPVSNIE